VRRAVWTTLHSCKNEVYSWRGQEYLCFGYRVLAGSGALPASCPKGAGGFLPGGEADGAPS
jgi:hypothetical protein